MNKSADIFADAFDGNPAGLVLYGHPGSTTETYAGTKGYTFCRLGGR